ncbi:hypothetical protein [Leifsonia sp. SIMBA_070]|uniref:hypothetical protein n=1 Tax=Leifsonia sp. SIMBA_070 TaxID=3085810 RepID=UPI00397AE166
MNDGTTRFRRFAATGAILAFLAAGAGLAGCTESPGAATKTTHTASVPGLPAGVSQPTSIPTDIPDSTEARANVRLQGCSEAQGGWQATGTAVNHGKKASTSVITVFFTTESATVIGTAQTTVSVKPGGTEKWTAKGDFVGAPKTLCVLRGVGTPS